MRHTSALMAGGIAVLALAGTAAIADPQGSQVPMHVMTVALPGGGVERIAYTGNMAPQVIVAPAPLAMGWAAPAAFWNDPSLAMLDRISAEMDRQMDVLFRQAEAMAAQPPAGGFSEAVGRDLPPGTQSWSVTTISTGSGACMRTVETTMTGNGKARTVSHQSGDCGSARDARPAVRPETTAAPGMYSIRYEAPARHPVRTSL